MDRPDVQGLACFAAASCRRPGDLFDGRHDLVGSDGRVAIGVRKRSSSACAFGDEKRSGVQDDLRGCGGSSRSPNSRAMAGAPDRRTGSIMWSW